MSRAIPAAGGLAGGGVVPGAASALGPAATPVAAYGRPGLWRRMRKQRHFYFFAAPFFVLFAIFGLYPLVFSLVLSFTRWNGITEMEFVGLRNFRNVLDDDDLARSLWNTLVIGLLYIPPMLIAAFLLALGLNASWLKAKVLLRASIFLPCVTPMVVIAIVFGLLLADSERGLLNYALSFFGVGPVRWLNDPAWSKPAIALLVIWRWTGYNMVLMLAGLQGISPDYYEAAAVDGAMRWRAMWHITLPLMRPTFLFCLILSLMGTVYMFDEPFILTQGGPGVASTNFGLYLFNLSFQDFKFGYASCVAYTVSVGVMLVSLLLNRLRGLGTAGGGGGGGRRDMTHAPLDYARPPLPTKPCWRAFARISTGSRPLIYLALIVAALLSLLPIYWLFISAFKSQPEIFAVPPRWLPNLKYFDNFGQIWAETRIARAFFNSVVIAVGHVTLSLFLCSLAGYAFAKFPDAPGNRRMFSFVLATMLIPGAVTLIPNFVVLTKLGLVNTYWSLIIPGSAGAFGIFWMRQYIATTIPDDLLHAARIDGCSEFEIYWKIVLPMCRPALAALGIMQLIGSWNNLMGAFLMLRTDDMQTLPVLIYLLQGETRTPFGMLMAGGLLTTLPLVLAFVLFQRQFISGVTAGAVKQ